MAFFDNLTIKYTTTNGGRHVQLMVLEQVFAQWQRLVAFRKPMNLLHWVMRDSTGTPPQPSKRPATWVHFTLLFCLLLPWQLPGQYGASSCLMTASSGFRCSPGHAALGNAFRVASIHPRGHRNGLQRRYICSSSSPYLTNRSQIT